MFAIQPKLVRGPDPIGSPKRPAINSVAQSLSKRRPGHAKACANEPPEPLLGNPIEPWNPVFPDIWT